MGRVVSNRVMGASRLHVGPQDGQRRARAVALAGNDRLVGGVGHVRGHDALLGRLELDLTIQRRAHQRVERSLHAMR